MLSGVANCLYGLTAALESGALALLTNLQVLQAPAHKMLLGACSDPAACLQLPRTPTLTTPSCALADPIAISSMR